MLCALRSDGTKFGLIYVSKWFSSLYWTEEGMQIVTRILKSYQYNTILVEDWICC